MFWVVVGVMIIVVGLVIDIAEVDGMIGTTIAWLLPSAPFGAAVGALMGNRAVCVKLGIVVWPVAVFVFGSIWIGILIVLR